MVNTLPDHSRRDAPAGRRFTVLDGMILIAATATGLMIVRRFSQDYPLLLFVGNAGTLALSKTQLPWWIRMQIAPFVVNFALGLCLIRLRRPRPRLARLFRQPGTIACFVGTAAVLLGLLAMQLQLLVAVWWYGAGSSISYSFSSYTTTISESFGSAVAIAWLTLALSRAWRAEPSWIDRAGRTVGIVGIVIWIAKELRF